MTSTNQSQPAKSKNGLRWLARITLGFVTIIVLLCLGGMTYETIAHAADMQNYPGTQVDIGGYNLHINCIGSGSPTIILEAGMGESSLSWAGMHAQLAEAANVQVCAYDRAGYGWSDAAPADVERTAQQMVSELHTLLDNAEIEPPYIIAGHSLGGLIARLYTTEYSQEVVGIVLVDSAHEDVAEIIPTFADSLSMQRNLQSTFSVLARLGVARVFGEQLVKAMNPDFPDALKPYIPVMSSASVFQNANRELDALPQTWEQVRVSRTNIATWSMPVTVLYSVQTATAMPDWTRLQTNLLQLSTDSKLITAETGHYIQYGAPELVISVIVAVVNKVRSS